MLDINVKRRILELRDKGFKFAEIADIVSVSVGTDISFVQNTRVSVRILIWIQRGISYQSLSLKRMVRPTMVNIELVLTYMLLIFS